MQDVMDVFDEMEGLDVLKIISCSAAGVGLIAALPIFGAIGTITAGEAIVGSLLGAGAGVAVVANDEEERHHVRRMADDKKDRQWPNLWWYGRGLRNALAPWGVIIRRSS